MERNRATQLGVTIRSESIEMLIYSPAKLMKDPFIGYKMRSSPLPWRNLQLKHQFTYEWHVLRQTRSTSALQSSKDLTVSTRRGKKGKQFSVVLG